MSNSKIRPVFGAAVLLLALGVARAEDDSARAQVQRDLTQSISVAGAVALAEIQRDLLSQLPDALPGFAAQPLSRLLSRAEQPAKPSL